MAYIEKKTKYIQKKKKKKYESETLSDIRPDHRDPKKNKWIQKKNKWIQKKKHIKPIDKVDLGEDLLPKTKIETIREPREPLPTPGPRPMKPLKAGGRAKHNIGGRANLLEEMGRIDARRHPDAADRAEKRRVIGELNRGYNQGGQVVKTIVSPGTHKRNIASAKKFGLVKGKPKLAKKGWK
jgi:hypothetical protein